VGKRYPSDLTDAQWDALKPLIPAAKPGGRPRSADMREVLNTLFYKARNRTERDTFRVEADVFSKVEDMAYNRLGGGLFAGAKVVAETVEYCRYPGNAYDRQDEKFRWPFGAYPEVLPEDERLRLQLSDVLIRHRLHALRRQRPTPAAAPGGPPTPGAEAGAVLPGQSAPSWPGGKEAG